MEDIDLLKTFDAHDTETVIKLVEFSIMTHETISSFEKSVHFLEACPLTPPLSNPLSKPLTPLPPLSDPLYKPFPAIHFQNQCLVDDINIIEKEKCIGEPVAAQQQPNEVTLTQTPHVPPQVPTKAHSHNRSNSYKRIQNLGRKLSFADFEWYKREYNEYALKVGNSPSKKTKLFFMHKKLCDMTRYCLLRSKGSERTRWEKEIEALMVQ